MGIILYYCCVTTGDCPGLVILLSTLLCLQTLYVDQTLLLWDCPGLVILLSTMLSLCLQTLYVDQTLLLCDCPGLVILLSTMLSLCLQTLYVDQTLLLCDCPGLVMPTFVSTKADMVLSGILPIDQMRDFVGPITRVTAISQFHHLPLW